MLSYLKDTKGWAIAIACYSYESWWYTRESDFEIFEIRVVLTKSGLEQLGSVGQAIFAFLRTLRDNGIPDYVIDEEVKRSDLRWEFQEKQSALSLVRAAVFDMTCYSDPKQYLSGRQRFRRTSMSTELVAQMCAALTVEQALVTVVAKELTGCGESEMCVERWYGAKYCTEVADELKSIWREAEPLDSLKIQVITIPVMIN